MHETMGIAVVGSGYVGTVVAACLAEVGHRVTAVEADPDKLRSLQVGTLPFFEPGLEDLVRSGLDSGRLTFTGVMREAVAASEVIFLCVGTPPAADGRPDMTAMAGAAHAIAESLDGFRVLVTKSTVPIGSGTWLTTLVEESLTDEQRHADLFAVASNPEFLREGSAVTDFLHPDRVVVGGDDPRAVEAIVRLYRPILDQDWPGATVATRPSLLRTDLATAETIKYAANAFLATKVSFINEVARICEFVGADVSAVSEGIGLDSRIGQSFLGAGLGWGGSCFGKDIGALVATAREYGYEPRILDAVRQVNGEQRSLVVQKLQEHLRTIRGRRVTLLGLAFKPGTDDLRDAPSLDIARELIRRGAVVAAHDPVVRSIPEISVRMHADPYEAAHRADAVVIVTEWPEFIGLDLRRVAGAMRGNLLFDGRNMFDPAAVADAGLVYEGIGRAPQRGATALVGS
jgi:UDPglucose 6-dehydrogenase